MLKTNYCVPDEKYSRKHVYILYFSCIYLSFGEEKKDENTANAALQNKIKTPKIVKIINHPNG